MKHGKKHTVAQRKLIAARNLDPAMWLIVKDMPYIMVLVHRYSDRTTRIIHKEG